MRRKWWPASLFGRLMTALLGVVGATVLIVVALIVRDRRDLMFWNSQSAAVVGVIAETSERLARLSGDARREAVERLRIGGLTIDGPAGFRRGQRELASGGAGARIRSLRDRLERRLGKNYRVAVRFPRPGDENLIRVLDARRGGARFEAFGGESERGARFPGLVPRGASAPIAPPGAPVAAADRTPTNAPFGPYPGARFGPWLGGVPQLEVLVGLPDGDEIGFQSIVPAEDAALPGQIFVDLGVLTVVLGIVLYFMTRTITQPLSDLAAAAEKIGRGDRRVILLERGARELRDATRAFNVMQERMHRYLDSRTQVLAAMSHDLRTPLTRLKLRIESIDDELLRERVVADLDEMSNMVTGALNLFRGLNDDEPARVTDVSVLLEEIEREFVEVGAKVEISGAAQEPILAKPQALKRCVTNLVANAVNYTGSAKIIVEDVADLVLRVTDDGPGIPQADLERVFAPFFRLESSRNVDTGGAGLGLSIARDIAQAHGGSLTLGNRQPKGLEAVLVLPRGPRGAPVACT